MRRLDKVDEKIDFKLDYMARLFRKTSHKRFETYVIQRIWHRLNDDRVQFVSQQYVKRVQEDYALADLYLPQVNIVVEINEPYHYDENQHKRDAIRNAEVSKIAGVQVFVVDCRKPMAELHRDIDQIVEVIRQKIIQLGDKFIPWVGLDERTPAYYQRKGYLLVEDNEYMETIDDICDIFHTKAKHSGFLRAGSVELYGNTELWFPNAENKQWHNEMIEDGHYLLEYPNNPEKQHDWMLENTVRKNRRMITFFRQKDDLGFNYYKFVGVFEIDKPRSTATDMCYWKRVADKVNLNEELGKRGETTKRQAENPLQPLKVKEIISPKSSNSDSAWSREKWENWEKNVKPALKIMDEIVAAMSCIQDGSYQLNYASKQYIGFAQQGKGKNFATFAPQPKALIVNAWGMEDSDEIEKIGKVLPNFEHKVTSRNVSFHTFKFPVDKALTAEQVEAALTILDMARKNYEK